MTAPTTRRGSTMETDDARPLSSLAATLRAIGIANQVPLSEQELTVNRSGQHPFEINFSDRVPFGFIFTAGHDATFPVPCGYRFWIEHISLSLPPKHDSLDVQMITHSRHLFQQVTLRCGNDSGSDSNSLEFADFLPIPVHAATANTLLFSNGMEYGTSIVPAGSYVQLWGYLEPTGAA